jgi:two-component system CheB/CheR fusion protein
MKKIIIPKRSPVKKKNALTHVQPSINSFYIVGIGASAGGLEALESFFKNMNENSGMAFIVVSHLDPNHISIMPELIQKSTKIKVYQAEEGMLIEPNHIYVTPANRDLAILHRTIQLIEPVEPHGFRLPIDLFFKSLASDIGEKAIAIVLSGMASDGTEGLKSVKSELGMVMVQEPKSAKFDGMPGSAIKTGLADYILPPEEMPEQLILYTSQKVKVVLPDKLIANGKMPDAIQKIFILLRNHTGHDFSLYKPNTIFRRIERRMNISQLDSLTNYIRMLQENPAEIENLFKELLIGVTNFFRDPESFERLKKVLSDLVKSKPVNGQIRIWVPGCSSGEEAYSIAILLRECMNETKKYLNVQIFATDIDSAAIVKARTGSYTGIVSNVKKEYLESCFTCEGNIFSVRKEIREMLVFAPQNIIKDPPFTKLDLISCRNLLIYFGSELQKKIIPLFHYSLLPGGVLFLGSSETIGGFVDLFTLIDHKWKLYKKRDSFHYAQPFIEFPVARPIGKTNEIIMKTNEVKDITRLSENIILKNYSPNCVIISGEGDIAYIHGRAGKYLELSHGEAKMNIYEMARPGLKQELPAMIRNLISSKKQVVTKEIKIKFTGRAQLVNLTIKLIKEPAAMSGFLLLIFEELVPPQKTAKGKKISPDGKSGKIIKELEKELKISKEILRSTTEELETSTEELKSTNEEMQSTNEEMQSSNEELETSKEELQSLNEELITVNTELQNKNDELTVTNNDMKNLLDSTDIPTIFLDNNLLIKRFTTHATRLVNLISSDIGRPLSDIAPNLKYGKVIEDAKEVLRTLIYKEIEVQTASGTWYKMRISPYRTLSNVIDGVVITFSDINNLKKAADEIYKLNNVIQREREYADNIINTVRESLLILDKDFKVLSANRSYYKMFNTVVEYTVGKGIFEIDGKNWEIPELRELLEQIIPNRNYFEDYEVEYNFQNTGRKKLILNARQIYHGEEETKLILLAIDVKV